MILQMSVVLRGKVKGSALPQLHSFSQIITFQVIYKPLILIRSDSVLPKTSKSVGMPELKAGPIPEGCAGVLVLCFNNRLRCSYQMSVTWRYKPPSIHKPVLAHLCTDQSQPSSVPNNDKTTKLNHFPTEGNGNSRGRGEGVFKTFLKKRIKLN